MVTSYSPEKLAICEKKNLYTSNNLIIKLTICQKKKCIISNNPHYQDAMAFYFRFRAGSFLSCYRYSS